MPAASNGLEGGPAPANEGPTAPEGRPEEPCLSPAVTLKLFGGREQAGQTPSFQDFRKSRQRATADKARSRELTLKLDLLPSKQSLRKVSNKTSMLHRGQRHSSKLCCFDPVPLQGAHGHTLP